MRCASCNKNLTDREASTKYADWHKIPNPEDRYIGLCDGCMRDTGLTGVQDPLASPQEFEDNLEEETNEPDDTSQV